MDRNIRLLDLTLTFKKVKVKDIRGLLLKTNMVVMNEFIKSKMLRFHYLTLTFKVRGQGQIIRRLLSLHPTSPSIFIVIGA